MKLNRTGVIDGVVGPVWPCVAIRTSATASATPLAATAVTSPILRTIAFYHGRCQDRCRPELARSALAESTQKRLQRRAATATREPSVHAVCEA